mmetsp:Transcript_16618/g.35085  ORF Transcript_16618/g.35085 Transcript_16618/m.35085 type:complete len:740 (+) Transcript_16618:202-2421(+)
MTGGSAVESSKRSQHIAQAAWLFEDTLRERNVTVYPSQPEARLAHFKVVAAELQYHRALIGMVLLSIFETPAWCGQQEHGTGGCAAAEGLDILMSGVWYIPPTWGLVIEVFLLCVVGRKLLLERHLQITYFNTLQPKQEYFSLSWIRFGLAMVLLELADCVVYVAFRPPWRLAFIPRAGFLCMLPAVVKLVRCVFRCLGEFLSVAVFLVSFIVFFAWIAVTIFKDMQKGTAGFDTFTQSLNSMFVAGVSDDFLVVFIKSYTTYRWVGILWLTFLAIAHVLLLSLVLDTLVAAYMTYSEHNTEHTAEQKVRGILRSFKSLAAATGDGSEQEVGRQTFLDFVEEFGRSPLVEALSADKANIMFNAIDTDDSGFIDPTEFCDICGIVQYRFWTTQPHSFIERSFPEIWNHETFVRFRAFVLEDESGSGDFDKLMTMVLLVNFLLVICETSYDLNGIPEPQVFDWLELIFSFVYLGEMAVKLSVISFSEYWSQASNQFDFWTTWLLLFTSIVEQIFAGHLSTYANMLRLLRLLRVVKNLKKIDSVQFMVDIVLKLLLASTDMMAFLGVVVFFFTMLSVQAFGGILHAGAPGLEGSEYLENHMLVLNCNDVPLAFGMWVVMLLCEYNPNFPDAISRVSTLPGSWLIFPIFYVIGVSIVFELVKAFTIEVFMGLKTEQTERKQGKRRKKDLLETMDTFVQAFKESGMELHYRVVGDLSQHRQIREALEHLEKEEEEQALRASHQS